MLKKLLILFLIPSGILSAQETIKLVKSFTVGATTDSPHMIATNNYLLFAANNDVANQGVELWITDGTTAGTKLLKNINTYSGLHSSYPRWFNHALGKVIFAADVTETVASSVKTITKLFITDGTEAGTIALCDLSYNSPGTVSVTSSVFFGKELNGKYYFSAETLTDQAELWVTDGTPAGTKMLKDINTTSNGSYPRNFEVYNNKLYFTATTGTHREELWVSDGTEAGTMIVKDIYPGNNSSISPQPLSSQLIVYKDKLYFAARSNETGYTFVLWVSDGTPDGTVPFWGYNQNVINERVLNPQNFYIFNDKLYFIASNTLTGTELYVTDGTVEGTKLVQDLNPGSASFNGKSFVTMGNTLYFPAKDATYGSELRKLSANSETIELVKDINTFTGGYIGVHETFYNDSRYNHMGRVAYGNKLIFCAFDNDKSYSQVWITDGTNAGTKKLTYNNVQGTVMIG